MSFVTLGGDAGSRPTFFELVAAERLMPSLKAALIYSLSVYAQRRPGLNLLLDREDELFFLVSVLLDRQALASGGASFAESLYGLKRAPDGGGAKAGLSPAQRQMSLVLLTLVPFLRAKLDAAYQRHSPTRRGPLGIPLAPLPPPPAPAPGEGAATRLRRLAFSAFLRVYPWVYACHEGARFGYQLLYLLGRTPYYSPGLHLLRLTVARVTGQDVAAAEQAVQRRRGERVSRIRGAGGPWPLPLLREGAARAGALVADHTRSALILSVFAFKLLEWWYTSAEQRLGEGKALPPPPPPPAPAPAPGGVGLPPDPALCPLCLRRRTNPAVLAPSGYAYCYPCVYRSVERYGCCPVTRIPAGVDHIRRLYQGA